jgi:hypothetical protein
LKFFSFRLWHPIFIGSLEEIQETLSIIIFLEIVRVIIDEGELADAIGAANVIVIYLTIHFYWDHYRGRNSLHLFFDPVTTPTIPASRTSKWCSILTRVAVSIFIVSQILMYSALTCL